MSWKIAFSRKLFSRRLKVDSKKTQYKFPSFKVKEIEEIGKSILTRDEKIDLETIKSQFVNSSPPDSKDAFLHNIDIYENTLDDVDYKFYLTSIENSGKCSENGTNYFSNRNPEIYKDYFKKNNEKLKLTRIGLDTQIFDDSNEGDYYLYNFMKLAALKGAVNVFATSSHCRQHRSERIIGSVLDTLIKKYKFSREEFLITTQGGFLFDDMVDRTPATVTIRDILNNGVLKESDIIEKASYCIHPAYLKYQISDSLYKMKINTIDVNYLSMPLEIMAKFLDRKEIIYRITRAFEYLEEMSFSNKINYYGITTENALSLTPKPDSTDHAHISMVDLIKIAEEVGGAEHKFRYVSANHSLEFPFPLIARTQKK